MYKCREEKVIAKNIIICVDENNYPRFITQNRNTNRLSTSSLQDHRILKLCTAKVSAWTYKLTKKVYRCNSDLNYCPWQGDDIKNLFAHEGRVYLK